MTQAPPPGLHADLASLAWLVGSWSGEGVGDYPTVAGFRFVQRLEVTHDGRPFLRHESRSWLVDPGSGERGRPLATEVGFWRPVRGTAEVELLLCHASGVLESWAGEVAGRSVRLATDLVARTATAGEVTGGSRVYGLIADGDLGWVYEMAAVGQPLQPHLSAQLRPAPGATRAAGPAAG